MWLKSMIFLDANILIELIVPGRAHYQQVRELIDEYDNAATTTLSAHLAWHFGRQAQVPDDLIGSIIESCRLTAITPKDYYWARQNEEGEDFEDALQAAASIRSGCEIFVTLDRSLSKRYQKHLKFLVP